MMTMIIEKNSKYHYRHDCIAEFSTPTHLCRLNGPNSVSGGRVSPPSPNR